MSEVVQGPSADALHRADVTADRTALSKAWYVVFVLTLANVSGFVDRQILTLLTIPIKRDLGVTDTQVSLLMGLGFVVIYSLLGLPIGRWVDRGRRTVIVALGALAWSVMTAATGLAHGFNQFFAARVGVGIGEATLGPAAVSMIADAFPRRRLGTAMSVYMMGTFFGSGVAYALGAWVIGGLDTPGLMHVPIFGDIHPWQRVFFVVGLPGILVALLAITMREPARQATPSGEAERAKVPFSEVFAYVRSHPRTMLAIGVGYSTSVAVNYAVGAWLTPFFIRTHGWTVQQAGLLQGTMTMTFGVIGSLLGGWLTDRWARRGMTDAPIVVGMVGAAGMLVSAGLFPIVSSATVAAILVVPLNIFAAMPWGAANTAVAEVMPARMRGQGSALYQLVLNLTGGALGPTAVALLTDRVFGDDKALRYSLSICAVIGMTLTIAILGAGRSAYRATVASRPE